MTEERAREIAGLTHFRSALTGDEIVESVTQLILAACAEERRACAEEIREAAEKYSWVKSGARAIEGMK